MLHPACDALLERSQRILAGGPATLSKLASRYPWPIAPAFLSHGDGAMVTCPDGLSYVDTVAALGPVILGHQDPSVTLAVMEQSEKLMSSTLSTALECEVAEMLCAMVPNAEMVRFASNGKDVTEAAIKVARYTTGRRHVIYCGYSGGFSDYLITTDKCGGILANITMYNHQVPWRDFEALDRVRMMAEDDLAAIILEVPPEYLDVTKEDTTRTIRRYADAAHAHGGVFILDEIVTGFRQSLGGAQEYYGVDADILTFSKAMGNGCPIAAIAGHRDLMQAFEGGKIFLSTTFGGSPIGLAAAKATIQELKSLRGQCRLREHGNILCERLSDNLQKWGMPAKLRGNFCRMVIDWYGVDGIATTAQIRTLWLQETVKHGVLFGVPIFPMCSWDTDIVDKIMSASNYAFETLSHVLSGSKSIQDILECKVIEDVFSSRYEHKKQSNTF